MKQETKNYVEEYYLDSDYIFGTTKEIESRENYINSMKEDDDDYLLLIRFFDRHVLEYENEQYYSEPFNYSNFFYNDKYEHLKGYSLNDLLNTHAGLYGVDYNQEVFIKEIEPLSSYKKNSQNRLIKKT